MKNTAQNVKSSTQKFTEIQNISGQVALLDGGYACMIIEITASNFALLSKKEQDSKVYAYASLLNSLSFPVQILIRNQRVDITSYLKLLQEEEAKTKNPLLSDHIRLYRDFIHQMIKVNVVLNKEFYLVITYSTLEQGAAGAASSRKKGEAQKKAMLDQAQKSLTTKADTLLSQLRKLAVAARIMEEEDLVKLFYNIYNFDTLEIAQITKDLQSPLVKAQAAV